ncbi:MAG: AAA family ATPase [Clostridiaceae bacterium]|nr:AAA family ATPase [Clostridiaceae bacterium]
MIHLSGYKALEEIYLGRNSIILRGIRDSDNTPVVIKLLNREYPSQRELSGFIREYEIMDRITGDGIIKAYAIEKYKNSLAIIMEDIGGESADRVLQSLKPGVAEKLSLAIQMTDSLIQLHQKNIIHKDVNPTNFIWNYKTNQVKLIDFGISAKYLREASQHINLNILEGSLDYLSPEQTGRINRPVDYRTDLYSLGITLYEVFTGQLPFRCDDEIEIIYSHIAKTPIPPIELNPEIPQILSDIIIKLISKAAEERYQSSLGLKKDLEYCLKMLEEKRKITGFVLGDGDYGDRFEIPHKLYGREAEIELMIDVFEKAADGHCEFLWVSGYSGIGKSSLIHEILKPITVKKGYFISGKYNQFEHNIPYYGIIQAFKELLKQLMMQSQNNLDNWKRHLLEALGGNGQIIIDLIPELEQLIGSQPQVAELNPLEAKNRFLLTLREFIKVFARPEHPLVVFLDDLQWSDTATLDLIKYIMNSGDLKHILFIGAYRDSEIRAGHPLFLMMEEQKNCQQGTGKSYNHIFLKPLEFSAVNQLIADTFHRKPDTTEPLSNIIFQKTKGNPFFISRMLYSLYLNGAFTFISDKGQWAYELYTVAAVEISDNVVEFLVRGLELLPEGTINILKLAACFDAQFDLSELSSIIKKSAAELGKDLWIAIEKEIVLPINNSYNFINTLENEYTPLDLEICFNFAHDRIRQAVYSLMTDSEKKELHLLIGREHLKSFKESKRKDAVFDLVNHLNIAICLIGEKVDRIELSELNIMAGKKAKKATAFAVALRYFETAESILSKEEWAEIPDKLFALLLEQANTALLSGDLIKADSVCEQLAKIAGTNLEKGAVANIKTQILIFHGKFIEAIDEVRKSLNLFNITLPQNTKEIDRKIQERIKKIQQFTARTSIEEIINLPVMEDPEKLLAVQLLYLIAPASQASPALFTLTALMIFDLTISYGTSPFSCRCFSDCGHILGKVLSDYETGYKLGEAAFALIKKFNAESQKPPVYFIFTFISCWRAHYKESLDYYDISHKTGVEIGDIMHAAYAIAHKVHLLMWSGYNLTMCKAETENAIAFLKQAKVTVPLLLAEIVHYSLCKFQTIPDEYTQSDYEDEYNEILGKLRKINSGNYFVRLYLYNIYVNIILNNMEEAEKWYLLSQKIGSFEITDFSISDYYMLQALILIHKCNMATSEEQAKMKETICSIQQKLKNWAENCPANFAHKYYLVSAQIAVLEKEPLDTVADLFEKALDSIGDDDFIQFRALCNELYGKFWLKRANETIGKAYIREAHYLYKQWGAHQKVASLEKEYAHYIIADENTMRGSRGTIVTKSSTSATNNLIDMSSILKSTQAISREIKIEKLLTILIHTMIENAGAQRGCLLLRNEADSQFYIEAIQDDNSKQFQVMGSLPLHENKELCVEIVQYVTRTGETLVINNAITSVNWRNNPYIMKNRIKSVLCMPVFYQNKLKSVVYLENNLSDNVFTSDRLETLKILSSQASISIENAKLYENMEEKIRERTIQLNNANEKLKELSLHDPLTGLHNRRYVFEFINDKIRQFIKNKKISADKNDKRKTSIEETVIGVYLIDIDHFKAVNDTYGHSAGDNVLIAISKLLKEMIRGDDALVRWGGEEFLIILFNTKVEYLEKFARKVLEKIKKLPINISENETIYKTCSLGYVEMPLDITNTELLDLEQTINLSDYALYCAKEHGRNCAAHFKLVRQVGLSEEHKKYLVNLSKTTKLNEEYYKIVYI